MLAVFPFCCTDLCAVAYHTFVGSKASIVKGLTKAAGCSCTKTSNSAIIINHGTRHIIRKNEEEQEKQKRMNNFNRNYYYNSY